VSFIYLDYNATTPIDPRVAEAMAPFLSGGFGNPSSIHAEGRKAKAALEEARERVAGGLGCRPSEVVFTSGGSESNNLAIRGLVEARGGGHVITSAVEHPAVLEVVLALEIEGRISLTVIGVDAFGRVDPEAVAAAFRDDTVLVSLMLANNEVGTLQPVREVSTLCRRRGVAIHTDAAQAMGKVRVDVNELDVDLLSVAGHKLYAPKGIGALFIRDGLRIEPQIRGAGHESGRRAGTENVLLAVGLGTGVGFLVADRIIDFLIQPLPTGTVQVLGPGDAFFIFLKVSIVFGIIVAMPVLLYQGWAFIAPGLTPKERRMVRPWIPLALVFFALGVGLAYVILPYATTFLLSFTNDVLVANIAAGPYFDFVTTMFLAFGLVMEFPIVLYALSRAGIVTSPILRQARRYVILGIALFAAVITPGGDLVSPFALGLTMYGLYEGTTFIIARTGR